MTRPTGAIHNIADFSNEHAMGSALAQEVVQRTVVELDHEVQGLHGAALGCYAVTTVAAGYALFQWSFSDP